MTLNAASAHKSNSVCTENNTASQMALRYAANGFKYRLHIYKLLINAVSFSQALENTIQRHTNAARPAEPTRTALCRRPRFLVPEATGTSPGVAGTPRSRSAPAPGRSP